MSGTRPRLAATIAPGLCALALALAPGAWAHGGEEHAPPPPPESTQPGGGAPTPQAPGTAAPPTHGHEGGEEMAEETEIRTLSRWPARVLAQQAHALIHIRDDRHEAGIRLHAAMESRDRRNVDIPTLRRAADTLERGDTAAALRLIDEALSKPLGARSGKLFHGAGREFGPVTGAQEIVASVSGAVLLLTGALLLLRGRRRAVGSAP